MRHIIHADLDAFYATVEQLDNPELRGKPVLVGGRPESRGVVATASYEARPLRRALGHAHAYGGAAVSAGNHRPPPVHPLPRDVPAGYGGFPEFTELIEPLSLDEAYLDISEAVDEAEGRWPLGVALELKRRVKAETGLTVSVGVSVSKAVSKIASDLDKPDGLVVVPPGDQAEFLAPLPVGKLWGIGPKTAERLMAEGVDTIGALAVQSPDWFTRVFGQRAEGVRLRSVGLDDEPVHTERITKSGVIGDDFPGRHRRHGGTAAGAGGVSRRSGREPGAQGPAGPHRYGQNAAGGLHHLHQAVHPCHALQ